WHGLAKMAHQGQSKEKTLQKMVVSVSDIPLTRWVQQSILAVLLLNHLMEQLEQALSPLEYMMKCYPEIKEKKVCLSESHQEPVRRSEVLRLLCLDGLPEPSRALPGRAHQPDWSIETVDTLAHAVNEFEGGVMLVSHDFRLIQQVAQEIWLCENQTITKWNTDILAYKERLKATIDKQTQDV
ncbi:hypothetical protein P4O66_008258, partial [Electrophorus voltai]